MKSTFFSAGQTWRKWNWCLCGYFFINRFQFWIFHFWERITTCLFFWSGVFTLRTVHNIIPFNASILMKVFIFVIWLNWKFFIIKWLVYHISLKIFTYKSLYLFMYKSLHFCIKVSVKYCHSKQNNNHTLSHSLLTFSFD